MSEENERRVREFYAATRPGHRERLLSLQAPHVVYEMPDGLSAGGGRFDGLRDVGERFLPGFYGAFDVRFEAEEFIAQGEHVVAVGRIRGRTRDRGAPVDVPFAHVWTVRDDVLTHLRAFTDTATLVRALAAEGP
jgi:ketosteroid isomerase-like protein